MMWNSSYVNKYAKFVCAFAICFFCISVVIVIDNGFDYLNPPVDNYEDFTYDVATSDAVLLSMTQDVRERYFLNLTEEDFKDESFHLFRIYRKEVEQTRPKNAMQGLVYMVLFSFLLYMHWKLVRDTGGWKRK